jgi:hypothetical protein
MRPRGAGTWGDLGSLHGGAEIDQVGRAARGAGRHLAGLPLGCRGRGLRPEDPDLPGLADADRGGNAYRRVRCPG